MVALMLTWHHLLISTKQLAAAVQLDGKVRFAGVWAGSKLVVMIVGEGFRQRVILRRKWTPAGNVKTVHRKADQRGGPIHGKTLLSTEPHSQQAI